MSSIKKDNESFAGGPVDIHLDPQTAHEIAEEEDAPLGVKTVEAAEKVYGKYSKWILFIRLVFPHYRVYARHESLHPVLAWLHISIRWTVRRHIPISLMQLRHLATIV